MVPRKNKKISRTPKPITAWAIAKQFQIKDKYGRYKKEYRLSGYDIFVDKDIEVGKDELLVRVVITPKGK